MGKKAPTPPKPRDVADVKEEYDIRAADNTLTKNAMNRFGPAGQSTFTYNENGVPTAISSNLSPFLNTAFANASGALQSQTENIPTTQPNFDTSSVNNILKTGMQTYDALAADPIRQGQNRVSQEIANRGLPINDTISQDLQGNFDRQNDLARQSAFSTLYQQTPGMQSTLDQNEMRRQAFPTAQASSILGGLIQPLNSLPPQAVQPQASVGSAGGAFAQQTQDNYNAAMRQYEQNQAGLGNLLKMGAGLALTPLTGGFSNTLLGTGLTSLGGLFNSSSPGTAANGGWSTTTTPSIFG